MNLSRRKVILGGAGAAALSSIPRALADAPPTTLPAKAEFLVVKAETCLNNARRHPISAGATREPPKLGFEPMTPAESTSPIVTFAIKDTQEIARRLKRANVDIAIYPHRVRISPSVYNDQRDSDKLLEALS